MAVDPRIEATAKSSLWQQLTPEQREVAIQTIIGPKLGRGIGMEELTTLGINTGGGTLAETTPQEVKDLLGSLIPIGKPIGLIKSLAEGAGIAGGSMVGEHVGGGLGGLAGVVGGGLLGRRLSPMHIPQSQARAEALAQRISQLQDEASRLNSQMNLGQGMAQDLMSESMVRPQGVPQLTYDVTGAAYRRAEERASRLVQPSKPATAGSRSQRGLSMATDQFIEGPGGQQIVKKGNLGQDLAARTQDELSQVVGQSGKNLEFPSSEFINAQLARRKELEQAKAVEKAQQAMMKRINKTRGPYVTKKQKNQEKRAVNKVKAVIKQNEESQIVDRLLKEDDIAH